MADKIVTLHPQNNKSDNLYPRVLGQSVRAGTNIAIDSTANTISVAQSLVDTINGKQTKGDYATNSTLTNNYYTKSNVDSLLATKQAVGNYALKSDIPTKTSQLANNSGYLISSDLKTSVSVVSNSDDTTSLKVSVGGVSSSVKTDTLKVGYANTAKQADNALSANHSVTSGLATNAVQLVKSSNAGTYYTYESLNNALNAKQNVIPAKGSAIKPVYFSANGTVAEASAYAGGTSVTLNGSDRSGSYASFYAPTSYGTAGYVLTSGESTGVPPKWTDPSSLSVHSASYANALGNSSANYTKSTLDTALNSKQNRLVSGTNLKTINGNSLLGSGNLAIAGNVTIGYVDIVNNISNQDDGTFWNAFTGHKAILGVYYHKERGASDTYDYEDFYSCMYFFQSSDVDPEATSYNVSFDYYPGGKITPVPTGGTIRIVYID